MRVLPESCGLGGDALFTIRDANAGLTSFNGSGRSPHNFSGTVPPDGSKTATVPGSPSRSKTLMSASDAFPTLH